MLKEAWRHELPMLAEFCATHSLSLDLVYYYDTTRETQPPDFASLNEDLHCMFLDLSERLIDDGNRI